MLLVWTNDYGWNLTILLHGTVNQCSETMFFAYEIINENRNLTQYMVGICMWSLSHNEHQKTIKQISIICFENLDYLLKEFELVALNRAK